MWLTPGRASGHKKHGSKLFMMAHLKRGHCTARSTVLVASPAMVKTLLMVVEQISLLQLESEMD